MSINKTLEFDKILSMFSKYLKTKHNQDNLDKIVAFNDLNALNLELNMVNEALSFVSKFGTFTLDELENIHDILNRLRLEAFLSLSEFIKLRVFLYNLKGVIDYKQNLLNNHISINYLNNYFDNLTTENGLLNDINMIINIDGEVFDKASLALNDLRKKIKLQESALRNKMNDLLSSRAKMLTDNLIVTRDNVMCLPVKIEYKNTFKGSYHGESASGTTIYIEPLETLEIKNKIYELQLAEQEEVNRILMQLSVKAWKYYANLKLDYDNILALDFIFAKGQFALDLDCYKPKINNNGKINLKKAYHPLIERNKCVPIDVALGYDYDCIIITGPNTGGKTVSLKTVGLLSLMIKYGFLIPCALDSEMALFDGIYAEIDTNQSISQSLSSFSAHMKNIIDIINNYKDNSLVLFDELGSGTDPKEGSNLAIAIIDYLLNKKAKLIVTTHYSDLKVYAYNNERVINASVMFDEETLSPLYKLLTGISGSSNALNISKRLGLNEEVIEKAKEIASLSETDSSDLLKRLEEQNDILSKRLIESENLIDDYNHKLNDINERENILIKKYLNFERDAKEKAEKIINKAKEEAKETLNEVLALKNNVEVKEHQIADMKHKLNQTKETDEAIIDYDFKIGDTVLIKSYNQVGTINQIKKDNYLIKMGNLSITVSKNDLVPHFEVKKELKKKLPSEMKNKGGIDEIKSYKLELDLRGFRYEEVKPALEKFFDQAYLAHINQVYVIHGYGTGAVRKACYEYFKRCPYIKETRFGGEHEGMNGVTVVTLK